MLTRKRLIHIAFIVLLVVLVGYEWRSLPDVVMRSDGFAHMLKYNQNLFWYLKAPLADISVGANLAGAVLANIFGPNVSLYLWFELGVILSIAVLFYVLVVVLTKSPVIAFAASFISSVSYFGNWNMYGTHCYCFYLERVINVPFIFLAFIFLHQFLTMRKMKFYLISFVLFFVGIALGHVDILFTPAFLLYPIWWSFVGVRGKNRWKVLFVGIPFAIATLFIVKIQPGFTLPYTFREFLFQPDKYNYLQAMKLQLSYWSQYKDVIDNLSSPDIFRGLNQQNASRSFPYLFILYFTCFAIAYKKLPKFRALIATSITSVLAMLFFNAYVKLPEIIIPNSNRYLYFPGFFLSIFWGIVVWYLFLKRSFLLRLIGIGMLIVYYHLNITLMNEIFKRNFEWGRSTKTLFSYVIDNRKSLLPNTLVVVQWPEFWVQEANFFTEQLGAGEVTYATEQTNMSDWKTLVPTHETVIALHYDSTCDCVMETKIK